MCVTSLTLVALLLMSVGCTQIFVKTNIENDRKLPHFWKSTGFSPPNPKLRHLLSPEVFTNIALIGALPRNGIEQVRVHWLLDLLKYENARFNFTRLDAFVGWMQEQKLKPGFEIMGTPEGLAPDEIKKIPAFWYETVRQIASRYIERYGLAEVRGWRFETWNEPDLRMYNTHNFTLKEYLDYVFECKRGLRAAVVETGGRFSSGLKLGGPAGLFKTRKSHPLCWGLLEICGDASSCPLQFLSFHRKGLGSAGNVLAEDLELIDLLHSTYPKLRNLPVANDEADILVNWSRDEEWRGDVRYAAMVAKVVIDHYKELILKRGLKLEVLSNDNGFLNYHPYYFTQRTLFARFQMNNTKPPHVQFVEKPVYAVMGLMSLLGELHVAETIDAANPLIGTLSSRDSSRTKFATLISYVDDATENDLPITLNLTFRNLPHGDCRYVVYKLDNELTNPFGVWKRAGSPVFPGEGLRIEMRAKQRPFATEPSAAVDGAPISLSMMLPTINLVHLCCQPTKKPSIIVGRVSHLRVLNVTRNEVLLVWKDGRINSKCIKTYEIEFSACSGASRSFVRINPEDTMFLSYHHSATGPEGRDAAAGRYRARAVDYFGRPGRYSKVISYPEGSD